MKNIAKKWICLFMAVCMVVINTNFTYADVVNGEDAEVIQEVEIIGGIEDSEDNETPVDVEHDELFAGFLEKLLLDELPEDTNLVNYELTTEEDGDSFQTPVTYGNFGDSEKSSLTEKEKAIYRFLKGEIEKIANGEAEKGEHNYISTEIVLPDVDYSKTYTMEDLGYSGQVDCCDANISEAKKRAYNMATSDFDLGNIVTALLQDCPYDLYWYDKTEGAGMSYLPSYGYRTTESGSFLTSMTIKEITVCFAVNAFFKGSSEYEFNYSHVADALNAVTNAKAIVEKYKDKSDYEKLKGYMTEICGLVEYNHDAVDTTDFHKTNMNPWQLIYVFDGDTTTNVVCEGYSKAFQYLCDLTTFSDPSITSYIVTGTMAGGTGAGGHMWNVVSIGGKQYLVDVTNCDGKSIGNPDMLFLAGLPGSAESEYTFTRDERNVVTYQYDRKILQLYGSSLLTLESTNYEPVTACEHTLVKTEAKTATCVATGNNAYWQCSNCHAVFKDEDGTEGTTVASETIAATGIHSYTKSDSTIEGAKKSDPTCTEPAKYYKSCDVCSAVSTSDTDLFDVGTALEHEFSVPLNATSHKCSRCSETGNHDFIDSDGNSTDSTQQCTSCNVKNIAYTGVTVTVTNPTYTGSEVTPTVIVKDGESELTEEVDYEITVSPQSSIGSSGYELTVTGKGVYAGSRTATWNIEQASTSFTSLPSITGVYGTLLSAMTLSKITDTSDDGVVGTWSITETSAASIYPVVGGETGYQITFTPDNTAYESVTKTVIPTVTAKPISIKIKDAEKTYNEDNPAFSVDEPGIDSKLVSGDTLTSLGIELSTPAGKASNAGTYPITATYTNGNYDITFTPGTLTINKSTPSKPSELTIEADNVLDTKVTITDPADGYVYEYKCGDGAWQSSNVFEGLTPNTAYNFYRRIAETDNTNVSESSEAATVTTKMTIPTFTSLPTVSGEVVYGTQFKNVTLSKNTDKSTNDIDGVWSIAATQENGKTDEDYPAAGNYNLVITFTPSVTGLYETVSETIPLTVAKKSISLAIENKEKNYNDDNPTLTVDTTDISSKLVNSDTYDTLGIILSTTATKTSNAGEYPITATYTNGNYNISFTAGKLTIKKISSSIAFNSYNPSKTYDGVVIANPTNEQLTLTGASYSDVVFAWYKDSVADNNKITGTPKNAGDYYLVATVPESTNLSSSSVTSEKITIAKSGATITVPNTSFSKTYGDASFSIGATKTGDGTLTYTSSDESVIKVDRNGIVTIIKAGTATVTISMVATVNCEAAVDKTVTIAVAKKDYTGAQDYIKSYLYSSAYSSETVDLLAFVPSAAGNPVFTITDNTTSPSASSISGCVVDGNRLKYNVLTMSSFVDAVTTVKVRIATDNYNDFVQNIKIKRTNCDHPSNKIVLEHKSNPTCTSNGEDIKKCTNCGEIVQRGIVVPALGHQTEITRNVEPKCETKGSDVEKCTVCHTTVRTIEVPATGHAWDSGVIEKMPTDKEKGVMKYTCTNDKSHTMKSDIPTREELGDIVDDDLKDLIGVNPELGELRLIGIKDAQYTGNAIKFDIRAYVGTTLLKEGIDYSLTYRYNKYACTDMSSPQAPSVTFNGKGIYSDKRETVKFRINPISMSDAVASNDTMPAANKTYKPVPAVKINGETLKAGKDYEVNYDESHKNGFREIGDYTISIVGKGNYTGSLTSTFKIVNAKELKLMSKATVSGYVKSFKYDGKEKEQNPDKIIVKIGKEKLIYGQDYTISYANNTEIGTASMIIKAVSDSSEYVGEKIITYKIKGTDITKARIRYDKTHEYSGRMIKPDVDVILKDGTYLDKDKDYTVTYSKNVNAGTGTIVITGIGECTGTVKKTFKIKTVDIRDANAKVVGVPTKNKYNRYEVDLEVKYGSKVLVKGSDYTVTYKNNRKPGSANSRKAPTAIIKGKGNFTKSLSLKFDIE